MPSLSDILINFSKRYSNTDETGIVVLKSKTENYPEFHILYSLTEYKNSSSEKAIIQFYPIIQFTSQNNFILMQNTKQIHYNSSNNLFQISINKIFKTCAISSDGNGFLIHPKFLRGYGLGTFAFYKLIDWAKVNNYGEYPVNKQPIGGSEKDCIPRFMLYIKNGLSLSAEAVRTQGRSGEYFATSLNNLTPYIPTNMVQNLSFKEYEIFISSYNDKAKKILKNNLIIKIKNKPTVKNIFYKLLKK